ncbi:MAG: PAS domain-containing protein [Sphingobacteriaceae bacterium]|nr:MAG: PAS domain-containing protein [Sphingobacteriaceae bacterium]
MENSFYRSIIENQSFYIIKTDLEGRYTYMNPYFCLILGIRKEDWLGKDFMGLIVPKDLRCASKQLSNVPILPKCRRLLCIICAGRRSDQHTLGVQLVT